MDQAEPLELHKLSPADRRLINPHKEVWAEIMSRIPPGTLLSRENLYSSVPEEYSGAYRDLLFNALVRYSVYKGFLRRLEDEFVRAGPASDSMDRLASACAAMGHRVGQLNPSTRVTYDDAIRGDGVRLRRYWGVVRGVPDEPRWLIFSAPILCRLDEDGEPIHGADFRAQMAARIETLTMTT